MTSQDPEAGVKTTHAPVVLTGACSLYPYLCRLCPEQLHPPSRWVGPGWQSGVSTFGVRRPAEPGCPTAAYHAHASQPDAQDRKAGGFRHASEEFRFEDVLAGRPGTHRVSCRRPGGSTDHKAASRAGNRRLKEVVLAKCAGSPGVSRKIEHEVGARVGTAANGVRQADPILCVRGEKSRPWPGSGLRLHPGSLRSRRVGLGNRRSSQGGSPH